MPIELLLDLNFWINTRPAPLSLNGTIFFASLFGFLIAMKFILKAFYFSKRTSVYKPEKKFLKKLESIVFTMGCAGVAWTLFAQQGVPLLSSKFWLLIMVLSIVIWAYVIASYAMTEMRPQIAQIREREEREKYLPKKK